MADIPFTLPWPDSLVHSLTNIFAQSLHHLTPTENISKLHITCHPLNHSLHVHEAYHSIFSFYLNRDWPAGDQVTRVVSKLMSPLLPMYKLHSPVCEPNASSCNKDLYQVHPGSVNHKQSTQNLRARKLSNKAPHI